MANYLKPQSPLQHKDGDYFYPLTTIDQIITKDNTRLNAELVSVNLDDVIEGTPNKINADTLQGYTAEDFFNAKSSDVQLNYSVVGGLEEPQNPTENMIWVETDVPITGHVFRNTEPTNPVEGMIWFITTTNEKSIIKFNRMIINSIEADEIYIISAMQYTNASWTSIPILCYQNNSWVNLAQYLYNCGDECIDLSGGWAVKAMPYSSSASSSNTPSLSKNSTNLTATQPQNSYSRTGVLYIQNKIDLTNFNRLVVKAPINLSGHGGLCIWSSWGSYASDNVVASMGQSLLITGEQILDISSLTGTYIIGFWLMNNSSTTNTVTLEYLYLM